MEPPRKSFLREWGLLIAFGLVAVAVLVIFRYWTEQQADAPVAPAYQAYLDHLSAESAQAREALESYYAKYARRTVASRHFEHLCGTVTARADSDGVRAEEFSAQMAQACREFAKGWVTGDEP